LLDAAADFLAGRFADLTADFFADLPADLLDLRADLDRADVLAMR